MIQIEGWLANSSWWPNPGPIKDLKDIEELKVWGDDTGLAMLPAPCPMLHAHLYLSLLADAFIALVMVFQYLR